MKKRQIQTRINYLKKYGDNIYKGKITLNDLIKELEMIIKWKIKINARLIVGVKVNSFKT